MNHEVNFMLYGRQIHSSKTTVVPPLHSFVTLPDRVYRVTDVHIHYESDIIRAYVSLRED